MTIKKARAKQFKYVNFDEWQTVAEQSLRGKSINEIKKETYEKILLKPLYIEEDIDKLHIEQYPGGSSSIRGFDMENDWKIAQTIDSSDWNEIKEYFAESVERGQETISFKVDAIANIVEPDLCELNEIVDLESIPLFLKTEKNFQLMSEKLLQCGKSNISGVYGTDVITRGLSRGQLINKESAQMSDWASTLERLDEGIPKLKTILIDTVPYSVGGANAVQELGSALGAAVAKIEYLTRKGWELEKIVEKMVFHFAIGSHFFTEVAKLRAFRKLWRTIADAYGLPANKSRVIVSAETSSFTKSVLDPYVNMLRAGNEAFAAVVGGVDYLHVSPFNSNEGDFSRRIARNTQLLLREESYLNRVVDPAGGSYYIESLTAKLVEKSWAFFQKIDEKGGIFSVLQSGWLQNEITAVKEQRVRDSETRKATLIGVNMYGRLDEKLEFPQKESGNFVAESENYIRIKPIQATRLAENFEELRRRSAQLVEKEVAPEAGLICLGQLKDYKARADFVTGVLSAGGITAKWSNDCMTIEDVKSFIQQSAHQYYCICGPDEQYEKLASEIAQYIKESDLNVQVDIAGQFNEEKLKDLNIKDTIHLGQNIYEKLDSVLHIWEERTNA